MADEAADERDRLEGQIARLAAEVERRTNPDPKRTTEAQSDDDDRIAAS